MPFSPVEMVRIRNFIVKLRERKRKERKERKRKKKIIGSLITPILTLAGAPRIFAITRGIFVAVLAKWYVQKKKEKR